LANEAVIIERLLAAQDGVIDVRASHMTGSVLIRFAPGVRESVLTAARLIDESYLEGDALPVMKERSIVSSSAALFARGAFNRLLPLALRAFFAVVRFVPFFFRGVKSILRGKLDVSALDAAAIGASLLFGDFLTASTIMTLLAFGELLESWTRERSKRRLAEGLALNESFFWIERDGVQVQISASELKIGDDVVIRAGSVIPIDGKVARGDAEVNESVLTGEAMPVHKHYGSSVYAGTILEEGELLVCVSAFDKGTRILRIVEMIDESESMKAEIQSKAERLADAVVPYSFLLAAAVLIVTGSPRKATSALLVDYSCAIKLSTPLAILSAMREGAKRGVVTKGGRALEKIAEADVVVFDKTGTLTVASPSVAQIIPFDGWTRDQVLRVSACLEEHFPHSIARAVVRKAEEENLKHGEEHAEVEYAVAHGIASRIEKSRVIIGSEHFVVDDEKVIISEEAAAAIKRLSKRYSILYLAVGGKLAGVICIEDPLRDDAAQVIRDLRKEGIKEIVLLTGDNEGAAEYAAAALGLDAFRARLLPEQKTDYVNMLRARGARIMMIGDGINDSPALSAADVGIAMKESADIAREISDVSLTRNDLRSVVTARKIADRLMRRIHNNYAFIIAVNSTLLVLGLSGVISPSLSALLHNASTIGASIRSLKPFLDDDEFPI
jgi:Cu2+-exporting ATPase